MKIILWFCIWFWFCGTTLLMNRFYIKILIINLLMVPLLPFSTVAQMQKQFPSWMDEVEFDRRQPQNFSEPAAPIDPATGRPASARAKGKFGRPNLPDMKKMREKAMKAELQRSTNEKNQFEQSMSSSIKNISHLESSEKQLLDMLKAQENQPSPELENQLEFLRQRLSAARELKDMLLAGEDEEKLGQVIASLTPDQFSRAKILQNIIFPQQQQPKAAKEPEKLKEPEPLLPHNRFNPGAPGKRSFYRPTTRKSIFMERREENEKQRQEFDIND